MNKYELPHFLADTWWFALTQRTSDEQFERLVKLRQQQGFTAAQIVVGIPPETGVYNQNAASIYGPAWDLNGIINEKYLSFVQHRIEYMNQHKLTAIIYGAWGHQIDWIGKESMLRWWEHIIATLDKYDVIYCLCGELDIWLNPSLTKILLPDKTSKDVVFEDYSFSNDILKNRCENWEYILQNIYELSDRPVIIHPLPGTCGINFINNKNLISANTFQTGHDISNIKSLWEYILSSRKEYPNLPAINLEYYYEGIFDNYYDIFQLNAIWTMIMSGCHSLCYGAHGIWNMADGEFLSQWGSQTFNNAIELDTPNIIGKTYKMFIERNLFDIKNSDCICYDDNNIFMSGITNDGKSVYYYSDYSIAQNIPIGEYFDVATGTFTDNIPKNNAFAVIFTS